MVWVTGLASVCVFLSLTCSLDCIERACLVSGMASIRSFGATERMALVNAQRMDANMAFYFCLMAANRWMSVRLEFLGGLMVLASAIFAILSRRNISSEDLGLSLSYALSITVQLRSVLGTQVCAPPLDPRPVLE
jgi:hypothetical protein